jgi:N-methylhydantoinase A/oxoprolinase/acetone carboxylase beta subunit
VPRHAGVLSALGMLMADVRRDYSASVLVRSDRLSIGDLKSRVAPLVARARKELGAEGFGPARRRLQQLLDVRYAGQSYEISVPLSAGYRREVDRRHEKMYGYANPGRPTEVVTVRVAAAGITDKPPLPRARVARAVTPRPAARRQGRFDGRMVPVAYFRWPDLKPGSRARGPAVITGAEASVVIPPGFEFRVDAFGNVIATRRGSAR